MNKKYTMKNRILITLAVWEIYEIEMIYKMKPNTQTNKKRLYPNAYTFSVPSRVKTEIKIRDHRIPV